MSEELKWAAQNGDLEQLKQAASNSNFDVNQNIQGGRTLLHCASDYGQTDVAEFLISLGANINVPDKHGITPLLSAIFESHLEVVKLLLSKGADKCGKAPSGESYKEVAEDDRIKALL